MQFPNLFSPLQIGRVTVANRISFSAHLTNLADNGLPSERLTDYLVARARGGAGLIITEEQSVHPTDRAYEHLIEAFQAGVIPGYKQLTRAVHAYDTRIFAQLNHNGQQCSGSLSRLPVWAPSPVPDVLYRETPKAMEIEDIREVIDYFARSAVHVREGGFDGVELQFGHSSLARQFMSPLTNYRGDEYGGDFDNRMRFPLEVVAAVRAAVGPDFTLGVRLCADELIPGGLNLEDAKQIAQRLQATGYLDYFNLTLATFYNLYLVGGPMHLPLGYTVPLAAGIKQVATLPVFATGRINDPALAERVLAEGQADMIGVVRGQMPTRTSPKKPERDAPRRSATALPATRTATAGWVSTRPSAAYRTRRLEPRRPRASTICARPFGKSGSWWWAEAPRACGRRRSPRCGDTM